jgi:hypothetical protein
MTYQDVKAGRAFASTSIKNERITKGVEENDKN